MFNPEAEMALAADREYYTPPRAVREMRRTMALYPANYAQPGDMILLPETMPDSEIKNKRFYNICRSKGIGIINPGKTIAATSGNKNVMGLRANPWGWNRAAKRFFEDWAPEAAGLPSDQELEAWRELAHRRMATAVLKSILPHCESSITLPYEYDDARMVIEAYRKNRHIYIKAPWSSSGRGLLRCRDLEEIHVEPWVRGIITKQGSAIVEKEYNRTLDFATEWMLERGEARFLGYSVFKVSGRGKYICNYNSPQKELEMMIKGSCRWKESILDVLGETLNELIAPRYHGPLGIDMLATDTGDVNPCVELNLRHTMGMAGLL